MKQCELCGKTDAIHVHHVLGRIGPNQNNPENLIELCWHCHDLWHRKRTKLMEDTIYQIMKRKHGDKFPIFVNGKRYRTKWLVAAEGRVDGLSKRIE